MILRNKLDFAVVGAVFLILAFGLGASIWLFIQEKRAAPLKEYEKFLQEEGGDKNGVPLEYQEDEDRKLLALQKEILGNGSQDVADTLARLTEIIFAEKKLPEAESLARESIAAYKKTPEPGQFQTNGMLVTLSKILWQENKMAEAEALARKIVEYQKTGFAPGNLDYGPPPQIDGLRLLASILWDEGKWTEAQAVYDEGAKVCSEYNKARHITAQKTQLNDAKRVGDTNAPSDQQIQISEQHRFRETNIVQKIPSWGGLIDPEGGCTVKADNETLAISIPEAIGRLTRYDPDNVHWTNISLFYTPHEAQILQDVKGDFTVQVKVSWKLEPKLNIVYADDVYYFDAGLLLVDGTNNIHFYSSLAWRSVDWSDERRAFDVPVAYLDYNLSSYKSEYTALYNNYDASMGFGGKFSYLRMSRNGAMIHLAISRDDVSWLEMHTLPLPPSEKVMIGFKASQSSHNPATVEFSDFKLTNNASR